MDTKLKGDIAEQAIVDNTEGILAISALNQTL